MLIGLAWIKLSPAVPHCENEDLVALNAVDDAEGAMNDLANFISSDLRHDSSTLGQIFEPLDFFKGRLCPAGCRFGFVKRYELGCIENTLNREWRPRDSHERKSERTLERTSSWEIPSPFAS